MSPKPRRRSHPREWLYLFLPRPQTNDRFTLYRRVFSDLIVLALMCLPLSLVSSRWGLPWPSIPVYAVLTTLYGFSEGLYKGDQRLMDQLPLLARSVVFAMLLVILPAWEDVGAPAVLLTLATSMTGLLLWRGLLISQQARQDSGCHNVLIVGHTPAGRAIANTLYRDPLHRTMVRGFVDDYAPLSGDVLGRIEDLDWLTRSEFIDEVIIALPHESALAREAAQAAYRNHLDIRAVPDLPGVWPEASVDRIGDVPVVSLHREPLPSLKLLCKRLLDVSGALAALLLTLPVMASVAAAIRLDSPGPILYTARRAGTKGRSFRCYKFRSMAADADQRKESLRGRNQRQGPIFKLEEDPRITRVGRFIRRYSLDELPQLWNILRGDMSLVGPRPHPIDEVRHYELHHYRRLDMKPGLTGLWQVTARKNPSFDLNMHLDLTYIENWTLLLDLRILMRTVRVLFAPEGA